MEVLHGIVDTINNILWNDVALFVVLGVGVLFTIWSGFSQYRALTHGSAVTIGRYDDADDPGAINHFQALSAALSATVGLGNIGGVALAIALGGPGAVFWMWTIGLVGMALKMIEVTLSMMYRNIDDPDNPHGGPMFVAAKAFKERGYAKLGAIVGGIFCITLLTSTVFGGNMFQAWNVAELTHIYFDVPQVATGIVLSILVGAVIIGGIKRIGQVAGSLVPLMVALYLLASIYVIVVNIELVPGIFRMIVSYAFSAGEAEGAFIGGTAGYAFMWGLKRSLFSSEAGQGSSPIAHSAAKTEEPVRESLVAGLEPFIDTIVVCTLTALVILGSGVWNRGADVAFVEPPAIVQLEDAESWTFERTLLQKTDDEELVAGAEVFSVFKSDVNPTSGKNLHRVRGLVVKEGDDMFVEWKTFEGAAEPEPAAAGVFFDYQGAALTAQAFDAVEDGLGKWLVTLAAWLFAISTMISWSYYGENGVVYLTKGKGILLYKILYCVVIVIATVPALIKTDAELDAITTLGTGSMLWVNVPLMLIFGNVAVKKYREYIRKLKAGEFEHEKVKS